MYIKNKIKSFIIIMLVFSLFIMITVSNQSVSVETSTEAKEEVYLPIIMYHSVLKDENIKNNYTVTPNLFEADLKYITENGYTTVTVSDLTAYVYENKSLPEKCIMLTFDDGYYNNYYYVYPLLQKYKCKAIISPIISITEKYTATGEVSISYGNIAVDEMKEMANSGLIEIQNHSYNMHTLTPRRGVEQKQGESDADYTRILTEDITKAQNYIEKYTDTLPQCFVYPFGAESKNTLSVIKELGFSCTLTCTEKANIISKQPESLYELGRVRRDSNESIEQLLIRIKNSQSNDG